MERLRVDARFRGNLARHYGIPEAEVIRYMRENVVFTRMAKGARTGIYGIARTGTSFRTVQNLPAGTPVFVLPGGCLVLKAHCGNAVRRALPPVGAPEKPFAVVPPPAPLAFLPPREPDLTSPETPFELPVTPPLAPVTSASPPSSVPMLPPGEFNLQPGVPTDVVSAPPDLPPGGGGRFPLIPPPFWFGGGGGDVPSGDGFREHQPPGPVPPVVPEPGSWALFLAGGMPVVLLNRRRLVFRPSRAGRAGDRTEGS